jgi:WD40 repeat protein
VQIWDFASQKLLKTLVSKAEIVGILAWSPDGKNLAAASREKDAMLQVWKVESGTLTAIPSPTPNRLDNAVYLAWSPDATSLASYTVVNNKTLVQVWDNDGKLMNTLS